jgi:hypothetical protein
MMELIEKAIAKKIELGAEDRVEALEDIARSIEFGGCGGLYGFALQNRLLIDDSAEEFAIQYYTAYNKEVAYRY